MAFEFPKQYNPLETEARLRQMWEEQGIHRFDPKSDKPIFSVDTPPPYVSSAHLHVGHAMSYSQAEFIVRFKRMNGFNVFYPMGFDDNGLPTERYVETKYKINKGKITRPEFVELCLKETKLGAETYRQLWEALAISVDWSLTYSTIDPRSRRTSQTSFLDLYEKGLIERRNEPIQYCFSCQTSLAQADVEIEEKSSALNDIVFLGENGERLIIATTRPELLPACVALYVNPEDERHQALIGKTARVPLFNYSVPIKTSPAVDMSYGTGLMMVCTWGDNEDVIKWKQDNLDTRLLFDAHGRLNELGGEFAGMAMEPARKAIIEKLKAEGLLLGSQPLAHNVGVHERCGHTVEFYHSPQWFIKVLGHQDEYLQRGGEVGWYPPFMKIRLDDWINGLKWDWCISRQRYYGVPFPLWYCRECHEPLIAPRELLPVDPTQTPPPAGTKCARCGGETFDGEPDVMDTWMTSSLTPLINSRWAFADPLHQRIYPMDIRVQAFEIIRTWLFYTVVKSHHHTGTLPWKHVMISGWGLDEKGKKMSKRAGNFVDPMDVIKKYSADALRYWSAGANLGSDLRYTERDVADGKRLMNKLWNAIRFISMYLQDADGNRLDVKPGAPTPVDRWILSRFHQVVRQTTRYLEEYEYSLALKTAERFFFAEFCDNYLEIIKERFWSPDRFAPEQVEAARHTLRTIGLGVLKLFAPFIPYITEELYQIVFRADEGAPSLHISAWPQADEGAIDEAADELGRTLVAILTGARRWKTTQAVHQGHPLRSIQVTCSDRQREFLTPVLEDLRAAARADAIGFAPAGEVPTEMEGITLALVLGEKKPKEAN
ncbi:MAG: valine--tRNA ligase [Myxococcales bacterium]|nr:valine--tRNA ligase [Myxococcales bacterium]